jgi:hypothetical protein
VYPDRTARQIPVTNPGRPASGDSPRHSLPAAGDRGQDHGGCGKGRRSGHRAFLLDWRPRLSIGWDQLTNSPAGR